MQRRGSTAGSSSGGVLRYCSAQRESQLPLAERRGQQRECSKFDRIGRSVALCDVVNDARVPMLRVDGWAYL